MSIGAALHVAAVSRPPWPPTGSSGSGVVVVASAGNEGALGTARLRRPERRQERDRASRRSTTRTPTSSRFRVSPDDTTVGYIAAARRAGRAAVRFVPDGTDWHGDDRQRRCNPLAAGSLTGKVALIRRAAPARLLSEGVQRTDGRAAGVVLCNNATGFISPTVAGTPPITIPVVAITADSGGLIDGRLATGW